MLLLMDPTCNTMTITALDNGHSSSATDTSVFMVVNTLLADQVDHGTVMYHDAEVRKYRLYIFLIGFAVNATNCELCDLF